MLFRNFIYSFVISLVIFLITYLGLEQSLMIGGIFFFIFGIATFLFLIAYSKFSITVKRIILYSSLGLIFAVVLYFAFALIFNLFGWNELISTEIRIFSFFMFILLGVFLGLLKNDFVISFSQSHSNQEAQDEVSGKILDSSVIIDGRILKIAKTNFIEGSFIIPNFVLREIQLISDSSDPVKRNRGRRGLDMLNELQKLNNIEVKISYVDYPEIRDVDSKLVRLARDINGKLITNDFNLEKVAEVQGIQVLNLNALTEALRPIVLPGEELKIQIVKEGKDENQGIGYLDDGTMVVIEDGKELIGKIVKVTVTSIIQTAAGKMIFTKAQGPIVENNNANIDDSQLSKKKKK